MSHNTLEPHHQYIRHLAGYKDANNYFPDVVSMGVPSYRLPAWDDIQIIPAQLAPKKPLIVEYGRERERVKTEVTIGKGSDALRLSIPLLVSDMSFGSLSAEAKIVLAAGAEKSGTAICSGEGGILEDEALANKRFMVQLGTAMFGFKNFSQFRQQIKAIHLKGGQAAKTGTGGLLPKEKLTPEIRRARGLPENHNEDVHSPATFKNYSTVEDFKGLIREVRERIVGRRIPVGYKLSANHIESDIQFALDIGVDYIILDGRGGATGAAPVLFRDHISVPTIPALARARQYLDSKGHQKGGDVKLIITGGLRVPTDFIKALALGADAVALSNSALQAIGCVATRRCYSNECPVGIATQDPDRTDKLWSRKEAAIEALHTFFQNSVNQMCRMAAACGHEHLNEFNLRDIATFNYDMARMAGVPYSGVAGRSF